MEKENFNKKNILFSQEFENKIYEKNKSEDKFWSQSQLEKKDKYIPSKTKKYLNTNIVDYVSKLPKTVVSHPVFPQPQKVVIPEMNPEVKVEPLKTHYEAPAGIVNEFLPSDLFANDPRKLTKEERHRASKLAQVAINYPKQNGLGLDLPKDDRLVAVRIGSGFDDYINIHQPHLNNDERWKDIRVKMLTVLTKFAVKFDKQEPMKLKDLNNESLNQWINNATRVGIEVFHGASKLDVPLYDLLFKEMDRLRKNGRNPLEVYLGRDGIYAYEARRAQDVSARRKMSWQERKDLKEQGQKPGLNFTYLVYPRLFRDILTTETKRKYLQSRGITQEADPVFYDTGFVGTIPEQILTILEYKPEEMDERMKLLTATKETRRVQGIPDSQRSIVVNKIEYNAKPEEIASGLYLDPKTGKIKVVAKASSAEEQYMYDMIRLAIRSSFYSKAEAKPKAQPKIGLKQKVMDALFNSV